MHAEAELAGRPPDVEECRAMLPQALCVPKGKLKCGGRQERIAPSGAVVSKPRCHNNLGTSRAPRRKAGGLAKLWRIANLALEMRWPNVAQILRIPRFDEQLKQDFRGGRRMHRRSGRTLLEQLCTPRRNGLYTDAPRLLRNGPEIHPRNNFGLPSMCRPPNSAKIRRTLLRG